MTRARPPAPAPRVTLSLPTRLTIAIVAAAVIPLGIFGILLIASGTIERQIGGQLLLFMVVATILFAVVTAYAVSQDLTAPLRELVDAVRGVGGRDLSQPVPVRGSDAVAQLAENHNELVADANRRTRQVAMILSAVEATSPEQGPDLMAERAGRSAEEIFGLIAGVVTFIDPARIPEEERVPGDPLPIRAELRSGGETIGVFLGTLPATRTWDRADQALLDLFASGIGSAIRNAQLYTQVERQNTQLKHLSEAKDDFLRGVSHNLQTPLTRIRANADALATTREDERLTLIADQSDRLSRMVAQLLLVSRMESQPLRSQVDVLAIAPRVRRAWDALSASERSLALEDGSTGWLAVGDADQLDQVLWALLDNAVRYGRGAVTVRIGVEVEARRMWMTIADDGPGISEADRAVLFERFARGSEGRAAGDGSGLGLYVARALMRGMDGDLVLEPAGAGAGGAAAGGASFRVSLPAEPTLDGEQA